jgi:hypothetical protein
MKDPSVGCYDPRYPRPYGPTLLPNSNPPFNVPLSDADPRTVNATHPTCGLGQRMFMIGTHTQYTCTGQAVEDFNNDPNRGDPGKWTACVCPLPCS